MTITFPDVAQAPAAQDSPHDGILAQLDALRRFITIHPSFPVSSATASANGHAVIYKFCDSAAEVDRIAADIGIAARWRSATQYIASLRVGLHFVYEVCYVVPPGAQDQDPSETRKPVAA